MKQEDAWKALAWVLAVTMGWAARRAAVALWSLVSDTEAPVNPADRNASWPQALGWAALAGLSAGLARVLGRRGAAVAWTGATGEKPPGT